MRHIFPYDLRTFKIYSVELNSRFFIYKPEYYIKTRIDPENPNVEELQRVPQKGSLSGKFDQTFVFCPRLRLTLKMDFFFSLTYNKEKCSIDIKLKAF